MLPASKEQPSLCVETSEGSLTLDLETRIASIGNESIQLQNIPYNILRTLMHNCNKYLTAEEICAGIVNKWGEILSYDAFRVHMHTLKHKLPAKNIIENTKALGYTIHAINIPEEIITIKDMQFFKHSGTLQRNSESIQLCRIETVALRYLYEQSPNIVNRKELQKILWKDNVIVVDNALSVLIHRLRKRLGDTEKTILQTISDRKRYRSELNEGARAQGYVLNVR